jgi:hypothetical protein
MAIAEMPDTFGLQEFYVTHIHTESVGTNVRIVCGAKRGGVMHWLYSVVIPAERLVESSQKCREAAERAISRKPTLETEASALH